MTDPLEAELDRLFRLPPAQLVEARNALADALRRAGDKAGAARIKAIKRAVPVAWALNQVQLDRPALLEHAREVTRELRELHGRGVDAKALAAAVERQRVAMQAVIEAALGAGRGIGMSENTLPPRKLFTTVQAWLAGRGEEPPGRMTQELEASGFEAFAGMTLPAGAPPSLAPVESAAAAPSESQRALAEAEQLAEAARDRAGERQAERAAAERAYEQAQVSVREAERQLAELRAMLDQRTRELERRTAALDEARARQAQAEAALVAARAARSEP